MSKTETAPAAPSPKGFELRDIVGQPIGVNLTLGPVDPQADTDIRRAASRVKGWSTFIVDGEPVEYSPDKALALFNRWPHFAEQVNAAK